MPRSKNEVLASSAAVIRRGDEACPQIATSRATACARLRNPRPQLPAHVARAARSRQCAGASWPLSLPSAANAERDVETPLMPPPPQRDRGAARETSPPPQRPFSCKRRGVRFSARRRGTQPPCSRPVGCACGGKQPRNTRFSTRTNERMPQTGAMRSTALNEMCRRAQGARGAPRGRSAADLRPRACLHGQTPASPEPHR